MNDRQPPDRPVPPLRVQLPDGSVRGFDRPFHVGREQGCELRLDEPRVSRRHAVVTVEAGEWVVRDLKSANGLFVAGARVESAPVGSGVSVRLGADGPTLHVSPEVAAAGPPMPAAPTYVPGGQSRGARPAPLATTPARAARTDAPPPVQDEGKSLEHVAERYFGPGSDDQPAGNRTMMIRRAFQEVQAQQRRRYRWMVAAAAFVAIVAGGYALYNYQQLSKQQAVASDLFYQMKAIDMSVAQVEQRIAQSGSSQDRSEIARYMEQRRQLEKSYDTFVANLYDRRLTEKERLILKVTRRFGEFELAAPPDYMREVQRYIARWQSTGRFVRAAKLAQDLGYPKVIADAFIAQDLPPQFFYLAMQESDFDAFRSGPKTRYGYAKGMWQFIPETGSRYGLSIGPLVGQPKPDPGDDRFKWDKATVAASRYIKEIYATDAQASGLLVMASYNWGERRVIDLIRTLPANPRERNFWKLLERYKERIPLETYDYVFYIVSAAVIGENPRLFGFQIDSPLGFLPAQ